MEGKAEYVGAGKRSGDSQETGRLKPGKGVGKKRGELRSKTCQKKRSKREKGSLRNLPDIFVQGRI